MSEREGRARPASRAERAPLAAALGCCMLALGCAGELAPAAGSAAPAVARRLGPVRAPAIGFAPERYVVYRAADPPAPDGRLDEACWAAAPWTAEFVDIEGRERARPRLRTRAKLLWDERHLYVAAELEEPEVWATLTQRDAVVYQDDDFEVFLDPDGDSHAYVEIELNALGTVFDLFLVQPYRDGGPALHDWDVAGLRSGVRVDGTLNDASDSDRGWSVELAIPWSALADALPGAPRAGEQWRANFSRVDWRTRSEAGATVALREPLAPGRPAEENWVWSPQGVIDMHYPEMWGVLQFSGLVAGRGREPFRPDPDEPARWLLREIYYRERRWYAAHGRFTARLADLGLEEAGAAAVAGRRPPWPPRLEVRGADFEASLRSLRIGADGRLRAGAVESPADPEQGAAP